MANAAGNSAVTSVALTDAKGGGEAAAVADTDYRIECVSLVDLIPEFRDMPRINMTNKTLRIVL